jgi:hypothetical protein
MGETTLDRYSVCVSVLSSISWWVVILSIFSYTSSPFVYLLLRNVYSNNFLIEKIQSIYFFVKCFEFLLYSGY